MTQNKTSNYFIGLGEVMEASLISWATKTKWRPCLFKAESAKQDEVESESIESLKAINTCKYEGRARKCAMA